MNDEKKRNRQGNNGDRQSANRRHYDLHEARPGERCSPQTIVTRCTLYKQYTTDEALETAADSYGGLTDRCMP